MAWSLPRVIISPRLGNLNVSSLDSILIPVLALPAYPSFSVAREYSRWLRPLAVSPAVLPIATWMYRQRQGMPPSSDSPVVANYKHIMILSRNIYCQQDPKMHPIALWGRTGETWSQMNQFGHISKRISHMLNIVKMNQHHEKSKSNNNIIVVNAAGFEPATFGFGIQCSANWAMHPYVQCFQLLIMKIITNIQNAASPEVDEYSSPPSSILHANTYTVIFNVFKITPNNPSQSDHIFQLCFITHSKTSLLQWMSVTPIPSLSAVDDQPGSATVS